MEHSAEMVCCNEGERNKNILHYSTIPSFLYYLELQLEQLLDEQVPQEELAVLLNFPPLEKAKADIIRLTFLPLHCGQEIFSEELKTNFSKSCLHWPQWYS